MQTGYTVRMRRVLCDTTARPHGDSINEPRRHNPTSTSRLGGNWRTSRKELLPRQRCSMVASGRSLPNDSAIHMDWLLHHHAIFGVVIAHGRRRVPRRQYLLGLDGLDGVFLDAGTAGAGRAVWMVLATSLSVMPGVDISCSLDALGPRLQGAGLGHALLFDMRPCVEFLPTKGVRHSTVNSQPAIPDMGPLQGIVRNRPVR